MACLPYFPSLAPLPYRPKRFHLGTRGEHHAFLGLLALLTFLGSLSLQTKTFSFRYKKRTSCLPGLACITSLPWLPYPTDQKRFHLSTESDNHAFLPLIPSVASFPYRPKRFHFGTERDHHTFLGLLAFLHLLGFLTLQTFAFM